MTQPTAHRTEFAAALSGVRASLADLAGLGSTTLAAATEALLGAGPAEAQDVLATVESARAGRTALDEHLASLLALQAPVAGDLQLLIAALRMVVALERMAELGGHIAEVVVRRQPERVVPDDLRDLVGTMAARCQEMVDGLVRSLSEDPAAAAAVGPADKEVDAAHHQVLDRITAADASYTSREATDVALIDRYYERFADQAVSVAAGLLSLRRSDG